MLHIDNLPSYQVCQVSDLFLEVTHPLFYMPVYNFNGHLYVDSCMVKYGMVVDTEAPTIPYTINSYNLGGDRTTNTYDLIPVLEPSDFVATITVMKQELDSLQEEAKVLRSQISSQNVKVASRVNRVMKGKTVHQPESDGQGDVFGTRTLHQQRHTLSDRLEVVQITIDNKLAIYNNYRYGSHQFLNHIHKPRPLITQAGL